MWLFSRDFIKLLLVANIIAWPVAYWMMNQWLTNFAYRIELGIGVFGLAGILTLLVALLTVNFQTLKAARRNPWMPCEMNNQFLSHKGETNVC